LQRNSFGVEVALREMGNPSLLAELRAERYPAAAVRWRGRLEFEAPTLTLAESQYTLAALAMLADGRGEAVDVLRPLLRKARPTPMPRMG